MKKLLERTLKSEKSERGIALLVVLLSIALLSSIVARYSYEGFIDYQLARNQADQAQAYYNARSGINMYKLILTADKQITGNPQLKQLGDQFGINVEAYGLWKMLPEIDTRMLRMLSGDDLPAEDKEAIREMFGGAAIDFVAGSKDFLEFEGDFAVRIENEDGKLNPNQFTALRHQSVLDSPVGRAMFAMMLDARYDPIFEGTNALEEKKVPREELIANIDDWVDSNTEPILYGGGSEDALYYRYDDQYRARNSRFETLQELHLVRGIDDDFMEEFASQLTVWSGDKVNINTAPRDVVIGLLLAYALAQITPEQAGEYADTILEAREIAPFKDAQAFVTFCRDTVGLDLAAGNQPGGQGGGQAPGLSGGAGGEATGAAADIRTIIGTDTKIFKITSTGYAGEARATITAVVDNTGSSLRYLYWRVD